MHTASNADDTSETSNTSATTKPQAASTADASADVSVESPSAKVDDAPTPSTSKEDVPSSSTSKENTSALSNTSDLGPRTETESSSEQEMLRKRRLQKFSAQPTTE